MKLNVKVPVLHILWGFKTSHQWFASQTYSSDKATNITPIIKINTLFTADAFRVGSKYNGWDQMEALITPSSDNNVILYTAYPHAGGYSSAYGILIVHN